MGSQELLDKLSATLPDNVWVSYKFYFPEDGKHLDVDFLIHVPFDIDLGADTFYYTGANGKEIKSRSHFWYVRFENQWGGDIRGFKTARAAFDWAMKRYLKLLTDEIKEISGFVPEGVKRKKK
jgi:hypothetical protein